MLINIILSTLFSLLITYYFIPIFKKKSWVSIPNERTSHRGIIPIGGSIGFITVTTFSYILNNDISIIFFLTLAFTGLVDDLKKLSSKIRLFIQSFIGITYSCFIFNDSIFGSLSFANYESIINLLIICFMAFFFVSTINFTNFADGLDGLLTGSMIVIFLVASYINSFNFITLVGGLLGFLILNWHPSKVFMGDAGSYFLGSLYFSVIFLSDSLINSLVLLVIGFPIYGDVMLCVIRRYLNKEDITRPHKLHIFQRLNQKGFNHAHVSLLYISLISILGITYIVWGISFLILSSIFVLIFGLILDNYIAAPFHK